MSSHCDPWSKAVRQIRFLDEFQDQVVPADAGRRDAATSGNKTKHTRRSGGMGAKHSEMTLRES